MKQNKLLLIVTLFVISIILAFLPPSETKAQKTEETISADTILINILKISIKDSLTVIKKDKKIELKDLIKLEAKTDSLVKIILKEQLKPKNEKDNKES